MVQDLLLRKTKNKKLVFDDPVFKVPPCSKEWFEDKDLARLQKMIYKKEKSRKKKAIVSVNSADAEKDLFIQSK